MIYTITFNPAIDYVIHAENVVFGKTNRSSSEEIFFGGKGINVSRVLHNFGVPSTALGFAAGFTGRALEEDLASDGIASELIFLKNGNTRINVKLSGITETEINAAGPEITESDVEKLIEKLSVLTPADTVVLSGSAPKNIGKAAYRKVAETVKSMGARLVVDAEGDLLTSVFDAGPYLVKPNRAELEGIAGRELLSDDDVVRAAEELTVWGVQNVLVSLGGDGAILVSRDGEVRKCAAKRGEVVSTVGSGDSMVAGFLAGEALDGYDPLALAVAAGSATAFGTGLATLADTLRLYKE
ncbi:MAG: 1-phosphofructokinase [Clostridia bacterium]|nr:1-phosphofructokinase [Clostridia bacterium]